RPAARTRSSSSRASSKRTSSTSASSTRPRRSSADCNSYRPSRPSSTSPRPTSTPISSSPAIRPSGPARRGTCPARSTCRSATGDPKLAGIVVMAGNVRPLEDLIVEQMTYLAKQSGEPDAVVMERLTKVKEQAAKVKDAKLSAETPAAELPLGVPAAYWLSLRGYGPAAAAAARSVGPARPAQPAPAGRAVYHPAPGHLWNRLSEAAPVRRGPDGRTYGRDRLDPLLWPETRHLLTGRSRDQAVAVL